MPISWRTHSRGCTNAELRLTWPWPWASPSMLCPKCLIPRTLVLDLLATILWGQDHQLPPSAGGKQRLMEVGYLASLSLELVSGGVRIWTCILEGSWTPKPGPWLAAPASMPPLKFRLLSSFPGIQGSCRLDGLLWSSCQGRPPPDSCSGLREPLQGEEVFLRHPLSLHEEPEEPRGSWDTDVEFLAKWAPF